MSPKVLDALAERLYEAHHEGESRHDAPAWIAQNSTVQDHWRVLARTAADALADATEWLGKGQT